MTIHVTCETCGRLLRGPDDFAGQQAICPVCQRPITLPGAEAAILPTPSPMPVLTSLEVVPAGQAPIEPFAGNRATSNLALDIRIASSPRQGQDPDRIGTRWCHCRICSFRCHYLAAACRKPAKPAARITISQ